MSILSRTTPKVRHAPPDLSKINMGVDVSKVAKQCRALSGEGDLIDVRNAMIDRYAQVIVSLKDEKTGTTDTNVYRASATKRLDYAASQAILAGQQEIVRLFLFNSVDKQLATLFTEPSLRFEYENAGTEEIIDEVRDDGNANLSAQRWDSYAAGIGSCALYLSDAGGVLSYQEIPPSKLWFAHAEMIADGGVDRPTNMNDLDEASVVVIEMAPYEDNRRFAAWYGPCDLWPGGRHVVYCAKEWFDLPAVGNDAALEYSAGARAFVKGATDVANPLSLIAASQNSADAPVYPIAMLYGDSMQTGIMPTTSTLYDVAAELDLMGSMVLGAAGRGARGATLFNRGRSTNVPDSLEGMILVDADQSASPIGWPASHSKDAFDVINQFARHVAESYGVPGWLVVADQAGEVPSGVALEIMTLPLTRNRNARIALNKHSVSRRFAIERLIINGYKGTTIIQWEETETWHAGERVWPRDPNLTLQAWQTRITMGEANLADVVRDMRGLKTDEQAWNWLEERKKDEEEHAELLPKKAEPQKIGLAQRLQGGGLRPDSNGTENPAQGKPRG